jgi:hypothetical protein
LSFRISRHDDDTSSSRACTTQVARKWPQRSSTPWQTRQRREPNRRAPNQAIAFIAKVFDAMREIGIDLSNARPQRLTTEMASRAQHLITMGCGDDCPFVPGITADDWPLDDPKGQTPDRVRQIRDEIRERVAALIAREHWAINEPR